MTCPRFDDPGDNRIIVRITFEAGELTGPVEDNGSTAQTPAVKQIKRIEKIVIRYYAL